MNNIDDDVKIYILTSYVWDSPSELEGVFTTREAAEKAEKTLLDCGTDIWEAEVQS